MSVTARRFHVLTDHGDAGNFPDHRIVIRPGWFIRSRVMALPGMRLLFYVFFGMKCWWRSVRLPNEGPFVSAGVGHAFVFGFLQWLFGPVLGHRVHFMAPILLERKRPGLAGLFDAAKLWVVDKSVDKAIVWGVTDPATYAKEYGVSEENFQFLLHHITLEKYTFDVGDDGYIFMGGNQGRDFKTFIEAVSTIDFPVFIATQAELKQATEWAKPYPHITVRAVTAAEFRQKIARCSIFAEAHPVDFFRTAGHQTMLNAMWMGKPIVMADKRSAIGYIEDGVDGLVVEAGDIEGMRSALKKLVDDVELRQKMSQAAQDKVKQPFYTTLNCMQRIYNLALKAHFERKGIKLEKDLIQLY